MEKLYVDYRDRVRSYKLNKCCCIVPIRMGLLVTGYFYICIAVLFLITTAEDNSWSPVIAVQQIIVEDNYLKSECMVVYAILVAFNALLLCGVYRNDTVLLRVYMYFVLASIISSVLVYSIVFNQITTTIKIFVISDWVFQCYVIVLVRSAIVEIKQTMILEKNGHVMLDTVTRIPEEMPTKSDDDQPNIEVVVEPKSEDIKNDDAHPEQRKDAKLEPSTKLVTVNENRKEE